MRFDLFRAVHSRIRWLPSGFGRNPDHPAAHQLRCLKGSAFPCSCSNRHRGKASHPLKPLAETWIQVKFHIGPAKINSSAVEFLDAALSINDLELHRSPIEG